MGMFHRGCCGRTEGKCVGPRVEVSEQDRTPQAAAIPSAKISTQLCTGGAMSEDVSAEQHEVQRKLGRCLLRLQQYEGLLKSIVAHQDLEGPADRLLEIRDKKAQALAGKTLGHLVGVLTGSYLAIEGDTSAEPSDLGPDSPTTVWLRTQFRVVMNADGHAQTVRELKELVTLRNDLVHHLIERFNVWTLDGCRDAIAYLDDCYAKIDSHFASLRDWTQTMLEAHSLTASFFSSKAWEDFFVYGLAPDGTVDWLRTSVVRLLREAEQVRGSDGWTSLASAISFISAGHIDETPKRYGCTSWRQVLHESKQFEVKRQKGVDITPGATWYRSRDLQ